MQTKPNERPPATGMRRTAQERHGVVNLDVVRYAHAHPDGPETVKDGLSGLGNGWIKSASDSGRIDHIEAVEPTVQGLSGSMGQPDRPDVFGSAAAMVAWDTPYPWLHIFLFADGSGHSGSGSG